MPRQPKRACRQPGCPNLVEGGGYCDKHKSNYNRMRRDDEESVFYRSHAWRKLSEWYRRQHPVCEQCGQALSEMVHHRRPIREGGDRFAVDNLQASCWKCHAREHPVGRG